MAKEYVTVYCTLIRFTPDAILITQNDVDEVWIPRSCVQFDLDDNELNDTIDEETDFDIEKEFADKKELEYEP